MKRWLLPGLVLLGLCVVPGAVLSRTLPATTELDDARASARIGWSAASETDHIARDIFDRVNDERVARGLSRLVWDDDLAHRARQWSEEMIVTGYRHSSSEFRSHPSYAGTGENIYMGPTDSTEAHVGWMLSDGHRDNLLASEFTAVGIGIVCRNDGRMWATQIFGMPPGGQPSFASTPVEPIVRRNDGISCPTISWWRFG